jgi:methylglutaconyl-CoA hydratase
MEALVLLTRDARGVATITLNRPEKRNAFDAALITQLHAAVQVAESDTTIRAVVLTGAGTVFSAGADLAHMRRQGTMSNQENYEDAHAFAQCLRALNTLSKPVIARVNGGAFGGGVGLIACADIAIGVAAAKFALTEVRFGIVPAVISPFVVAAIGARHARRWFLTAMTLDAAAAREMVLLHQVVDDAAALDAAVEECLGLVLKGGSTAHKEAKQLVSDVETLADNDLPHHTASLLAKLRSSSEGKEGLAAFLESRKAEWDRN